MIQFETKTIGIEFRVGQHYQQITNDRIGGTKEHD